MTLQALPNAPLTHPLSNQVSHHNRRKLALFYLRSYLQALSRTARTHSDNEILAILAVRL